MEQEAGKLGLVRPLDCVLSTQVIRNCSHTFQSGSNLRREQHGGGGGTGCPAATTFDIPLKWLPLGQIHGLEINLIPSQMLS